MDGLTKAIEHFKTQRALAEALGVTDMAVTQWKKRGVPPEVCLRIERATSGAVTRADLLPELFGEMPTQAAA